MTSKFKCQFCDENNESQMKLRYKDSENSVCFKCYVKLRNVIIDVVSELRLKI